MDNSKNLRVFLITVVSGFAAVALLLWFLQRSGQMETIVGTTPIATNAPEPAQPPPQAIEQPVAPVSWPPPASTPIDTRAQQAQAQAARDRDIAERLRQRRLAEERIDRQEIHDAEAQLANEQHITDAFTRRQITGAQADRITDLRARFLAKYGHMP